MKIKSDCKKVITKISLNIELEQFEIETFKNILSLAEARIRDQYCGGSHNFQLEREMLRNIEGELK